LVLGLAVILGYAPNPAYADCTISSFTITCDVGSGNTDTYASDIADSSFPTNLVKTGYGKQILSSTNNTYTGDTTVTSGTLAAGATNAF
ncbi:autotransporter-associated beta strand repeat-containing protein, partial [Acinetobacter baumannii]